MNIFLTKHEKERLAKWKYHVEDNSLTSEYLNPFFNYITTWIPDNVAPNVITLMGLLCTLYAYYLTSNYFDASPRLVSLCFAFLTFAYMCLDAADGKHARKTRNSSSLGELFDHSCDNIGVVFMMSSLCTILGITNTLTQWYIIQISQLIFLNSHIEAYRDRVVKFGRYSGPGEILCLFIGLALIGTFKQINLNVVMSYYNFTTYVYYIVIGYLIYQIFTIQNHNATRNGLLLSLAISFIPSMMIRMGLSSDIMSVIGNGIILSVLTGDIIVSKMANKEMHSLVPIMLMMSLFNNYLSIALTCVYYIIVISEITWYMNIPLFNVNHNVFCNGVYDLCHVGHMNLFEKAASYGTRLIVGVHDDITVTSYKRKPIMTHVERCEVVAKCRFVSEVVPNMPLIIDEEFIKKYNIHTVVCSVEFDKQDDKYYEVPRKMGILKVLPRTYGISTTNLIDRLKYINENMDIHYGC
ncbi:CDP-alcohol phosphatidyltransferase [Fadolivirus algeromassiliense]|jgi:choline-phosphate cytidylyltransferase|uniref:CDP-alcohol phosphatidyltransferase n=1 Tax=Fadolivirus FV1/VV64 TaxID=3070911 RepID=A0A7D3UVR7_9VIRU|nr:CDP-alcohol phosphatidyltransferase [Fadolivirus algeromassiliense]QKF94389.1 CDP-alcohol phosphatidyltransferase [Fadolivirus FV1/VV64]